MAWLDGINRQIELFGPRVSLGEITLQLRAAAQGIASWEPSKIRDTVELLQMRLDNWKPSQRDEWEALDEAWHQVVAATVREVMTYTWWQQDFDKEGDNAKCLGGVHVGGA